MKPSKSAQRKKQLHEGHRARLRKKWQNGTMLEKHEFLELLLFFSISRKNTNEIAHALLQRFGSIEGILRAPEHELLEVRGVGKQTVLFLGVLSELVSRYHEERIDKKLLFRSRDEMYAYLNGLLRGQPREVVYLLLFNSAGRLLFADQVGDGFASMSEVSMKRINQLAVQYQSTSAVLAHNHPDGLCEPSVQDQMATKRIAEALALLGVNLMDHVIVSKDQCVSVMRESRYVCSK